MEQTTRTSIILIIGGVFVALGSLALQSWVLKRMPPEKRKAAAEQLAVKRAAEAGGVVHVGKPAGTPPSPAAPAAPAPPPAQKVCRQKLAGCFADAAVAEKLAALGDCYLACGDATGCEKKACGDYCEGVFGLREACP